MNPSRLRRMARARWWILATMAILGAIGAVAFTNYNNSSIEPRISATGSIYFHAAPSEDDEAVAPSSGGGRGGEGGEAPSDPAAEALVDAAILVAEEVNADLLEQGGVSIVIAEEEPRIDFQSAQPSEAAARAFVEEMRDNYVAVDPTAVDVQGELASVIERSTEIRTRLDELTEPVVEEAPAPSPEQQAEIDVLTSRRETTLGQIGVLQDELLDIDPEDEEAVAEKQAQIDAIEQLVLGLDQQIDALTPDAPETVEFELTPAEELEKTSLEAELETVALRYQELQELAETGGDSITVGEIVTEDLTPAPTSPTLAVLIGLIVGLMLGVVVLVLMDRIQGTVWAPSDMDQMPILAEVPQGSGGVLHTKRYKQVRQAGIQSIRSAMLGLTHVSGPTTIGFTGLGAADEAVSGLVLELGRSLAGVGRTVLIVDGQIGGLARFRNEVSGGTTLADIAVHHSEETVDAAELERILDGTVSVAPNLNVLPGDPRTVDPVDVLSSTAFHELTLRANKQFDLVIVVGPSALSPYAYVMTGQVSAYVVVATMGRTRQAHILKLAKQFAGSPSRLVGAVLLGVKPRRGYVATSDLGTAPDALAGGNRQTTATMNGDATESAGILDRLGESLASLARDKGDD